METEEGTDVVPGAHDVWESQAGVSRSVPDLGKTLLGIKFVAAWMCEGGCGEGARREAMAKERGGGGGEGRRATRGRERSACAMWERRGCGWCKYERMRACGWVTGVRG